MTTTTNQTMRNWSLEDIHFDEIDKSLISHDQFLFATLTSASFVEIHSEKYASNLIALFQGDGELTDWLDQVWQRDEVQHGLALKAYVQAVWPEFNWELSYRAFALEYDALCTVDQLEQRKALELIARCVVETGTSSFYQAMHNYVREPVLGSIIDRIRTDETSHYRHFRRHFLSYNLAEQHGAIPIVQTVWRRLKAISGEDARIAFKHVCKEQNGGMDALELHNAWRQYNQTVRQLSRKFYPHRMAIKMLVKPLPIAAPFKKMLIWPLTGMALLLSGV